jgi:hypothetical protein
MPRRNVNVKHLLLIRLNRGKSTGFYQPRPSRLLRLAGFRIIYVRHAEPFGQGAPPLYSGVDNRALTMLGR